MNPSQHVGGGEDLAHFGLKSDLTPTLCEQLIQPALER
jgi:hypothetical protein